MLFTWTSLIVAVGIAWVVRAIYNIYFHPLSRYPGPKVAALSNAWWEWYWNYYQNGRMIFEIERLHRKHGSVIRIGVNDLHVSDMHIYQDINKVNTDFRKDAGFYQFISFPGTSIGETDTAKHRIRRKVLAPALSGTRIQELAPIVERKTQQLLARFDDSARAPVCVTSAAKAFTMDIISRIVLGQELGCVARSDYRSELSDNLQAAFSTGWIGPSFPTLSAMALWISRRVPVFLFPMPHVKFRKSCIGITHAYLKRFDSSYSDRSVEPIKEYAASIKTSRGERSPVIDMLMDPNLVPGHKLPTVEEIGDELIMLLTAGSDTSSNAMISGIYFICRHGVVYKRLFDELKSAFPKLDQVITYEKAKELPYLVSKSIPQLTIDWWTDSIALKTAVIRETLRLGHPLPGRLPRTVPEGGYSLHGGLVPPGVNIHTSAYILNRHPDIWEKPNDFDPTRWLGDDVAALDKQSATFGRGARQCLGKDLAWCELWVLLANLFRRFEVSLTPECDEKDMEWVDIILVHFTEKLYANLVKRRE
ncbi:hypothetical protein DL771_005691 [Monosporascus sp. 5C6A]|nr:hypothetical protein DL771_005691 [Monosporascus sp. 5C6A]